MLTQEDKRYLEGMMDSKLDQALKPLATKAELESLDTNLRSEIQDAGTKLQQEMLLNQQANIHHHVQTREMLADLRQEHAQLKEKLHAATAP